MMRNLMGRWRVLFGALVLVLGLGAVVSAEDSKAGPATAEHAKVDQQLADTLRDVHNKGADLYNNGDRNGCYRMFQGALIAVKPLLALHPGLQKEIEDGLAAADKQPRVDRQAFALHELIEGVRGKLKTSSAKAKTAETKTGSMSAGPPKAEPKTTKPAKTEPKTAAEKKTEPNKPVAKTLWDRLGGEANVKKVVDDFLALAMPDPKVNATRGGKFRMDEAKTADLKSKLVDMISEGSGGPRKYKGKTMKEAHAGMGITDTEFDAAGAHFAAALKKNGVAPADVDEAMKVVGTTRKDIVELKKPEEKKSEPKKTEAQKTEGDATVQGKVTLNGKPPAPGSITFHRADEFVGFNKAVGFNKEGEYRVMKLPPGTYKVTINAEGVPAKYGDTEKSGLTYEVKSGSQSFDIKLN